MATVPPLPLSLSTARATFGQGPGSLNAMRRGAGIVPDYPANAHVPAGSPIALSQLVGATTEVPASVNLVDANAQNIRVEPNNASARLQFGGLVVQRVLPGSAENLYTWYVAGDTSLFQARATLLSGTVPSGDSLGVWHPVNGSLVVGWTISRTTIGESSCSLQVEIRRSDTGAVLGSATWTLMARKELSGGS